MNKTDKHRLDTLLDYWVKHNKEHTEEFTEWAGKAEKAGHVSVRDNIMKAVQRMSEANEFLLQALKTLRS